MTIIVGLVAEDGTIYMGGDSAATTADGDQMLVENRKVFFPVNSPWYLIGFAGSFRLGQILRYSLPKIPRPPIKADIQHYMATRFVDGLRRCFKASGFTKFSQHGQERGGFCLIGYQGKIYRVEDDFQILLTQDSYSALGAGQPFALGSLHATGKLEGVSIAPEDRVALALQAAVDNNSICRGPLYLEKLPFIVPSNRRKRNA